MKLNALRKIIRSGTNLHLYWNDGSDVRPVPDAMIPIAAGESEVVGIGINHGPQYSFQNPAHWPVELAVYLRR